MKRCVAVGVCLFSLASVRPSLAQTYPDLYVSASGSDTHPYTNWAMAAHALGSAIQLASDGTTIHVTDGTYSA